MHWSPVCLNTGLNMVALVCYILLCFFTTSVPFFISSLVKFIAKNGGAVWWWVGVIHVYMCSVAVGEAFIIILSGSCMADENQGV